MNDDRHGFPPHRAPPGDDPPGPPPGGAPDLVDRLVAREEAAFEELVRTSGPRMLAVASRYLPRPADAEDALQDALTNVVRNIGNFRRASRLETWLHQVVVNSALTNLRRRAREVPAAPDDALQSQASPLAGRSTLPTAHQAVVHDETRRTLAAALERLPAPQRALLLLRDVDAFTIGAIAELLDVRVPTVRVRLHRARRALRRVLRPRLGGLVG